MDTQANKSMFLSLLKTNVKRDGIDMLISMLEKSDFFIAPASTRYHDSEEGGLCNHSLKVFQHLLEDTKDKDIPLETITIVSLLHDVCKIGFYAIEMRNTKNEHGNWIKVPFYTVDDKLPYGHGEKSVFMLQEFLKLTLDEAMAIRWHMGGFESTENRMALSKAFEEFPLALFVHVADMKSIYLK